MAQYARGDDVVEGITPRERVQLEAAGFQLVPEPQEKQVPDDDTSGEPEPVDADESRGRGRRRRSGGSSES